MFVGRNPRSGFRRLPVDWRRRRNLLRGFRPTDSDDLLALPLWLSVLGIMAAILWLIARMGAEFRRRLQLYEFLLDEALRHSEMSVQRKS